MLEIKLETGPIQICTCWGPSLRSFFLVIKVHIEFLFNNYNFSLLYPFQQTKKISGSLVFQVEYPDISNLYIFNIDLQSYFDYFSSWLD